MVSFPKKSIPISLKKNINSISFPFLRFFIFHPECRGQYGKRSTLPALAQHQPNESPKFSNDPNLDFGPKMEDLQMKNLLTYCSRYVFAPICRGVTSKRATVSPLVGNNHAIYDLILRQIKKQQEETKSDTIDEPSNLTPSEQVGRIQIFWSDF